MVLGSGFGGTEMSVLDITNPVSDLGFAEPPIVPLWHAEASHLKEAYDRHLGKTISVPGFYFNQTSSLNDFRLIFGSGYPTDPISLTQGRRLVAASALSGAVLSSHHAAPGGHCTQPYTLLADVATARHFATNDNNRLLAAYTGDTWGNLWRYTGDAIRKVESFGCQAPLHFAPTAVQLDRDDPAITQRSLPDSSNKFVLRPETQDFAPSQMIILKEHADLQGDLSRSTTSVKMGKPS